MRLKGKKCLLLKVAEDTFAYLFFFNSNSELCTDDFAAEMKHCPIFLKWTQHILRPQYKFICLWKQIISKMLLINKHIQIKFPENFIWCENWPLSNNMARDPKSRCLKLLSDNFRVVCCQTDIKLPTKIPNLTKTIQWFY